jgi:hypothetical protein
MNGPFDELAKLVTACMRSLQYIADAFRSALVTRRNANTGLVVGSGDRHQEKDRRECTA